MCTCVVLVPAASISTMYFHVYSTRVGQSGAARTIVNALWKWCLPRTCVPVLLMRNMLTSNVQCTLNVYGETGEGVENTPPKSGSLFA